MSGRVEQDVELVVTQPTTAKADVKQDLTLVVKQPTTAKADVKQDLTLVVKQPTDTRVHINQDVMLVVVSNNLLIQKQVRQYIISRRKKPFVRKHWGQFQNAALIGKASTFFQPCVFVASC